VLALRITVNIHTSNFVCSHTVCGPADMDQSLRSGSRKGWDQARRITTAVTVQQSDQVENVGW
jgi:hypothetical protein